MRPRERQREPRGKAISIFLLVCVHRATFLGPHVQNVYRLAYSPTKPNLDPQMRPHRQA